MDVRLLVCRFIWDDGFGSISDALECLRLCREEGAAISTNSWGGVPHSREPIPPAAPALRRPAPPYFGA
jgi:hypothetical protein